MYYFFLINTFSNISKFIENINVLMTLFKIEEMVFTKHVSNIKKHIKISTKIHKCRIALKR